MDGAGPLAANEFLWKRNALLEAENQQLRKQVDQLQQQVAALHERLATLSQPPPATLPPFVKANVPQSRRRRRPGRKAGHAAALRPRPASIDVHQEVPLPLDGLGQASCPQCGTQLNELKQHQRLVEELIPSRKQTTCYHTASGYCPCCRKRVESRAADQPPAADLPHAQLGLNALATAAILRIWHRLPLRQITELFAHLPGMRISAGGLAKQIQRLGRWLAEDQRRLKEALRAAQVVHADETSWRTNGKNGYLWTLTNARHTLYHVDRSRGGKVIAKLLGENFGRDGQTLVSDFYSVYDQLEGRQQKCLTHLLRELRETVTRRPELKKHRFFSNCKRLVRAMLRLKKEQGRGPPEEYAAQVQALEKQLEKLSGRTWNDADADRLTARLRKYRTKLSTFLHQAEVEGTNNAAERAIRPVVVSRKISGGSRSPAGAEAFAILSSVIRTAHQQQRDLLETLKRLLRAHWSGQNLDLLVSGD